MSLTEHRLDMLAKTLVFLREQSPYYSELLADSEISPGTAPALLRSLPILTPSDWARVRTRLRTASPDEATMGYTNGTTGIPSIFYSTPGERAALLEHSGADSGPDSGEDEPRSLHLIGNNHGVAAGLGLGSRAAVVPVVSPGHFELAARLIARDGDGFDGPPVRQLGGTLRLVKDLSLVMLTRYGRADGFGVERIEVGRHMLSPRWRERLETWWGAEVKVVYGLSELRMCNARTCADCGYHHLPPSCVGEVVHPSDPLRYAGPGERGSLVLTAFHPYVQLEPRIRYRPGDLVELAPEPCPRWGESGFRPLGRERNCAPFDVPGADSLTPADCFAVLADLPEVAVGYEKNVLTALDERFHETGSPRFRIEAGQSGLELHVELRYDPRIWSAEARALEDRITGQLPGGVKVSLYAPATLRDPVFV